MIQNVSSTVTVGSVDSHTQGLEFYALLLCHQRLREQAIL
jgi:hypothetical protein